MINFNDGAAGNSRSASPTSIPTLKLENLSQDFKTANILETRQVDGKYGKQVAVKLTFGGGTYIWYLKLNNPNLRFLVQAFGQDETTWAGNEFMLGLEHDSFNNRLQMRCKVKEAKTAKR